MTMLRLTVVVPTRNRPQSLQRLLQSLGEQTLSPEQFEVVVVDDGSEPALDLRSISDRFSFAVRLVRRSNQPGAHESRHAGLRVAAGER